MQRASDGWWESSHPTIEKYGERGLCGILAPPHCELIGLWECKDEAEEKALHEQFNEGVLKRKDCHNEFYEEMEWPKIYRELCTWFTALPLPAPPEPTRRWRAKGRGRHAAAAAPTGASTAPRRLTSHGTGYAT